MASPSPGPRPQPDCQPPYVFLKNEYMSSWGVARLYVNTTPSWATFRAARSHAATYAKANPKAKKVCGIRKVASQLLKRRIRLIATHMVCHQRRNPNCPLPPGGKFSKFMPGPAKALMRRVLAVPLAKPLPKGLLP